MKRRELVRSLLGIGTIAFMPVGIYGCKKKEGLAEGITIDDDNSSPESDEMNETDNEKHNGLNIRLSSYLGKRFDKEIKRISVDAESILIQGTVNSNAENIFLAEIPMWQKDMTKLDTIKELIPITSKGDFSITLDRFDSEGYDRLISGWALLEDKENSYQLLSSVRYADNIHNAGSIQEVKPSSIKGILASGFHLQIDDYEELGVETLTMNVVLNGFIYTKNAGGREPYQYGGKTWYIQRSNLEVIDKITESAAQNNRMVSAIILIHPRDETTSEWTKQASYPIYTQGANYTLTNFTDKEGVIAYAAALNYLAERYSSPERLISNYIMHNEIQQPEVWTSAADVKKPLDYMYLYGKSMRLAHMISRQYHSHSKVLISLDHHWKMKAFNTGFSGRELVELMVQYSRQEGDFPWGLAFHPYPVDLRNPKPWTDTQTTFRFNTPYITFKNLEVLNAYVKRPNIAYLGTEPREIQLSEQSINAIDYSEEALEIQAVGLAYAWKKIKEQDMIKAFQYFPWADFKELEDQGLLFGLRKFGDYAPDPYGKKPIWEIFKAMGSSEEDDVFEFAKVIIGILDWEEIHHRDEIF